MRLLVALLLLASVTMAYPWVGWPLIVLLVAYPASRWYAQRPPTRRPAVARRAPISGPKPTIDPFLVAAWSEVNAIERAAGLQPTKVRL